MWWDNGFGRIFYVIGLIQRMFNFEVPEGQEKRYVALVLSLLYPSINTIGTGGLAHVICTYGMGGSGPSCFYSAISGMRFAMGGTRNNWIAALIVLVNLSDYGEPASSQFAHIAATVAGYCVQMYLK